MVPDCTRPYCAGGYCRFHYNRVRRTGTPYDIVKPILICSVEDCGEQVKANGLCQKHYRRAQRHGDPTVRLRERDAGPDETRWMQKVSVESPGCWLWKTGFNGYGYGSYYAAGKSVLAHRYVYEILVGPIPDGTEMDHLCRRPACVNPDHLEPVTHQVNVVRGVAPARSKLGRVRNVCTIEGCDRFQVGRGLCKNHYYQQRRRGWDAAT
jgi:hypothetical protein